MRLKVGPESIPDRLKLLGYRNYREYLFSDHWKSVKYRFFRSKLVTRNSVGKFKCAVCDNTTNLQVHHRTYKRLGKEWLADIILLCHEHHELAHKTYKDPSSLKPNITKKLTLRQATRRSGGKVKKDRAKQQKKAGP